jgi:hypothetical protein
MFQAIGLVLDEILQRSPKEFAEISEKIRNKNKEAIAKIQNEIVKKYVHPDYKEGDEAKVKFKIFYDPEGGFNLSCPNFLERGPGPWWEGKEGPTKVVRAEHSKVALALYGDFGARLGKINEAGEVEWVSDFLLPQIAQDHTFVIEFLRFLTRARKLVALRPQAARDLEIARWKRSFPQSLGEQASSAPGSSPRAHKIGKKGGLA